MKADWRGLARWLDQAEIPGPSGPVTLVVHPSDPRFPRDQIEAARYYLCPPYRVLPDAETSAGSSRAILWMSLAFPPSRSGRASET